MNNKNDVAQQVAELTAEQRKKLYKVGLIGFIVELVVGIPWMIILLSMMFSLADPTANADFSMLIFWGIVGVVFFAAVLITVKVKCPYYSDKKWRYIRKLRKANPGGIAENTENTESVENPVNTESPENPVNTESPENPVNTENPTNTDAPVHNPAAKSKNHLWQIILFYALIFVSSVGQASQTLLTAGREFSDAYTSSIVYALLTLVVLSVVMMAVPFICTISQGKLPLKSGKKLCLWNSIIIFALSVIAVAAEVPIPVAVGGLGALLFYFINKWIFVQDQA